MNNRMQTLLSPRRLCLALANRGALDGLGDEAYIRLMYRLNTGKGLHLQHAQSFAEKLQWLKLHDRRSEYTRMVDKVAAKEYAAGKIGAEHVLPLLGVWEDPDQINFDALPERFVLKCSHDSGGVILCRDKAQFDRAAAIAKLKRCLQRSGFRYGREWPYRDVPRRVLAEALLSEPDKRDLTDYKVYCFGGEPKFCQVITDRSEGERIDFFDLQWKHMPFTGTYRLDSKAIMRETPPARPAKLPEMISCARILAEGMPFARIDFYIVEGSVFFGEITLFPASGFGWFEPQEWNRLLGDMIVLPE